MMNTSPESLRARPLLWVVPPDSTPEEVNQVFAAARDERVRKDVAWYIQNGLEATSYADDYRKNLLEDIQFQYDLPAHLSIQALRLCEAAIQKERRAQYGQA
jgi:hypothetical protein